LDQAEESGHSSDAASAGGTMVAIVRERYRDLEPDRRIIFDGRTRLAAAARFGARRDFTSGTFCLPSEIFEIFVAFCPLSMTMAIGSFRLVLRLDAV
jgi:hypothetical protein